MAVVTSNQPRDRRFQLRATASEEELIKVAADQQGVNVTEFIMRSACEEAEQALADRTRFVLDEERWTAFMAALDRPAQDKPRLRKLFQESHVAKRRRLWTTMQCVWAIRNMLALAVAVALWSNVVFAQQPDASARIYARLSKLPRNAEIEVRLLNKGRVSGHLVRFDQRELVLAEHTNPILLADVKSLKEVKPPRQGPAWNPVTGFISSWKQAAIVGGLLVGLVVLVKTNTR